KFSQNESSNDAKNWAIHGSWGGGEAPRSAGFPPPGVVGVCRLGLCAAGRRLRLAREVAQPRYGASGPDAGHAADLRRRRIAVVRGQTRTAVSDPRADPSRAK